MTSANLPSVPSSRRTRVLILAAVSLLAMTAPRHTVATAADNFWTGGAGNGNFSDNANWSSPPSWGFGNSLVFNANTTAPTLTNDYGSWRDNNDIYWDATFPVARTLQSTGDFGINLKIRVQNNSSFTQTVTMPLSGGKDGAGGIQLNPVVGSLTLSGSIYNDNSVDYAVFGSQTATVTNLTLNTALGPNATQTNVDFTVAGGRNTAVQVNASQVWAGTTDVQSGSFTTANGVTLASTAIVVGGGTVATTSANTLADAASLTVNTGRLSIGGSDTVASLAGSGGTVELASGATLTFGGTGSTSYAGSIVGSGNLTKAGSGTFTVTSASTLSGTARVTAGQLTVGAANLLADTVSVVVDGGGLSFNGSDTIGSLAGTAGTVAIGANTLTVSQSGTTTYAGAVTGNGTFTKTGSGILTLTGNASAYAGATQVQAGTVAVNGSLGGSVDVSLNAILSGTGTVGGNATIAGTHSPGNSPGAQTFNGNLTYQASAVVNWELIANTTGTPGTNYDQIIVPTGNLTFSGSTTLALSFDSVGSSVDWADPFWNVNRSWMVYDLSGGTTNSLSDLGLGGSLLDSLNQPLSPTGRGYFTTSLSGQDVMLNFVAVPEPLTLPLVGIAAAFLLIRRRVAR